MAPPAREKPAMPEPAALDGASTATPKAAALDRETMATHEAEASTGTNTATPTAAALAGEKKVLPGTAAPAGEAPAPMEARAPIGTPVDSTIDADWPNRDASRFVDAAGVRWHLQVMGDGPALVLVHGTGAATHSWRDLAPLLAARYTVVAFDLPGHGFTSTPSAREMSLPAMSRLCAALLDAIGVAPAAVVGHSAGAAILARMALDRRIAPEALVALNGAFVPFDGVLRVFSPVAKLLASAPLVARLAAARARDDHAVRRLLDGTGSALDERGRALYARLVRRRGHVAGALSMMAAWDLQPLFDALPRLCVPTLLVVGENDRTVPPAQSRTVAARLPDARVAPFAGLGHLAHEEQPEAIAETIAAFADAHARAGAS